MFVSVLIPAYNAERWVAEAIESVLQQSHREFELILVDDGSTDSTLDIFNRYAALDGRITVISHENRGMGASLNEALETAQGEWIVRMDADDIMMPNRIERQVAFVKQNPDVAVASCLVTYINAGGETLGSYQSRLVTRDDFRDYIQRNEVIGFHHPGVIMRKDIVQQVGGYRPEYWNADDLDLWNRVAETGYYLLVQPEYLLKYRIHGSSISNSGAWQYPKKARWVEYCMLARRAGESEPSFEEFLAIERSDPLFARANRKRRETGEVLYKLGTLAYSSGEKPRTALLLTGAFACFPSHTLKEVRRKFLRYLSERRRTTSSDLAPPALEQTG